MGCNQVSDIFIISRNISQTCVIECESGYVWDGNGTCFYNGTHHFETDNCIVKVTETEKGMIERKEIEDG